jgi:hypothetical protein
MRHRLPLVDRHRSEADVPRERRPLPGVIGIADTSSGEAAARFALALAVALRELGAPAEIALVAFGQPPSPDGSLAHACAAAGLSPSLVAIDATAPAWCASSAVPALWVLAGLPALIAFAPSLAIVLGAERPIARWPRPLLTLRGTFHLALCAPLPGLPGALASALWERRFLLR